MTLTRAQAKIYRLLRRDIIQHLMFGATVLIVIFCYFAIHAWYQGKAELLETFGYKREAFFKVFREALGYTLLLGLPVGLEGPVTRLRRSTFHPTARR